MSFFKVVRLVGEGKFSAYAYGEAVVDYVNGADEEGWISAPGWLDDLGYWICGFEKLEDAERFAEESYLVGEIWECSTRGGIKSESDLPKCLSVFDIALGKISKFGSFRWASGTAMAEKVKLDRLVRSLRK